MSELRFVTVRIGEEAAIEVVAATPKGTLRVVPLSEEQALTLIRDTAGYLRTIWRREAGVDR